MMLELADNEFAAAAAFESAAQKGGGFQEGGPPGLSLLEDLFYFACLTATSATMKSSRPARPLPMSAGRAD